MELLIYSDVNVTPTLSFGASVSPSDWSPLPHPQQHEGAQVQGQQVGGGSRTSEGSLGMLRGPRMGPDPMGTGVMVVLKDRYASRVYSLILLELKGVIIKTNYTFSSTNNFKLWIFPHICNELNKGTFQYIKINVLIINHVKNVFIIYYNLFQIAKRIQILP